MTESNDRDDRREAREEARELREQAREEREENRNIHFDDDGIIISHEDLSEIISGIRDLPPIMNKMASSVEILARNLNVAPTRKYTTWLVIGSALLVALMVFGSWFDRRSSQNAIREVTADTNELVTDVAACLAVTNDPEGNPVAQGVCAQRLFEIFDEGIVELRQDVRCELQVSLIDFVEVNDLDVEPPSLNTECIPYAEGRADDGN
jgi:hypothetical protein